MNKKLLNKLDRLEIYMSMLTVIENGLRDMGFKEQANYADTLAQDINFAHYDLVEAEGPVIEVLR